MNRVNPLPLYPENNSSNTDLQLHNLYDLDREQLGRLLGSWGFSEYYANLLWKNLYRDRKTEFSKMGDLRPELLQKLKSDTSLPELGTKIAVDSRDGLTRKFLLSLNDGQTIETVLMRYPGRATVCISTQVGCAMGCVFCATGQMGFLRNLTPGEIVGQVLYVISELEKEGDSLRNIVLMGMGEPLHNYDSVMTAIDILTHDSGLAIGPRYITLSTVGLPKAIRRLADEQRPINLAVSLHAATDDERSALVPINQRWTLGQLVDACRYYIDKRGRRIFFEWALIAGKNDTAEQAHAVGQLLQGLDAHVNLIPLNPTSGYEGSPSDPEAASQFQEILASYNLPSTIRQRRGIDIDAGCGQLRAKAIS